MADSSSILHHIYMSRVPLYMRQYRSYEVYERPMSDVEISAWLGWALGGMIRLVNVFTQPDDHCDEMLSLSLSLSLSLLSSPWLKLTRRLTKCISAGLAGVETPRLEPSHWAHLHISHQSCLLSFHTHAGHHCQQSTGEHRPGYRSIIHKSIIHSSIKQSTCQRIQ